MKNQRRLYKSIAICVSVITAVTMTLPTITSAVGMIGTSRTSSAVSGAAAPKSSKNAVRSEGEGSAHSSTSSTSSNSTRSADDADDKEWIKLPGRNLKWLIIAGTWDTIHLKPIDPKKPVYGGNTGYGTGSGKFDSIFGTSDGNYSGPGFRDLKNQIKTIIIDENMTLDGAESMFQGYAGLQKIVGLDHIKFADNIKDNSLQSMFAECTNLETLDGIQNWDMSNITNTSFMFANDKKLKNIDLSGWENVKIKNAWAMFYECNSLTSVKLFKANSDTLADISQLFHDDINLTSVTGLGNWNTKNVRDMSLVFANNQRLEAVAGVEKWNTSSVKTMYGMFYNTQNLKTIAGINNWNTSSVIDMSLMFLRSGVESLDLSKWKFPQGSVRHGKEDPCSATSDMFKNSGLRDLTLPTDANNKNTSIFPDGIWRKSKGKSAIKPGENIDFVDNNYESKTGYIRWVRDYIKVTFASKVGNAKDPNNTITCVADVLQGKSYTLGDDKKFVNCTHKYTPGKDLQLSGNPANKDDDREKLALQAEELGLTYTAKLIRKAKKSSIDVLKNLLKEADSARYKTARAFTEIKRSLGIVEGDTVKWQELLTPIFVSANYRRGGNTLIMNSRSKCDGSIQIKDLFKDYVNPLDIQDKDIKNAFILAPCDVTFTANVTHKQKPKPPVPTPPAPQPQPMPTPTPTPTPTPEPGPTPSPSPSPSPIPEPTPDDSDILPDITPKPDLNINENENPKPNTESNPFNPTNNAMHNAYKNLPQLMYENDAKSNALPYAGTKDKARLGVKEYVGSNSGTCKCVCPTLPKDAKSHKSNKSVRKSSNKATPCKSGNNYSWLGIGGLIISWLIMLLIGFIVGYKMRKKRDDNQSYANQSAIED
ncbi:BspA family leucine-rich repeat surface protein [Gardnerella vaginalis]|uniref:BspA family leucine-rich repeat surface protein n=1 Tax=Gardnerella vaginalis TaxID=2702 RepID=UPI0039706E19